MQRLQGYQFLLSPNGAAERQFRQFAGVRRYVYNRALALQQERYAAGEKKLGYTALCAVAKGWRHDPVTPWLEAAHSQVIQQALKDLEAAYANFFSGQAGFPKFRKKWVHDRFRFPQGVTLDQPNARIFLPKIGCVGYRKSRGVPGVIKSATVSFRGGRWYVSVLTARDVKPPVHPAAASVGIDAGIARFATLSDGSYIDPLNALLRQAKHLADLQRDLARKVKHSRNWRKQRAKIGRLHARIANSRRDFLHKATHTISKNHALVIVEDLQVRNMSRSAKGTVEQPGRNVWQKAGLNRAILDQGWGEFRRQLEYKQAWRGGELLAIPPAHTSQTCPVCGHVHADNRRTQARFCCVECGYTEHADLVAAINIHRAGHARSAGGEAVQSGPSMKQEPSEATAHGSAHA